MTVKKLLGGHPPALGGCADASTLIVADEVTPVP